MPLCPPNISFHPQAKILHQFYVGLRTMGQSQLNHLMHMILHVHKESTDELSLESCLNGIVAGSEHPQIKSIRHMLILLRT